MRSSLALAALLALAHCAAPPRHQQPPGVSIERSCGLIGCISSPYLAARIGPGIIGAPVTAAVASAGAPSASYRAPDGSETLTWRREQRDGGMQLACEETITARDGRVATYSARGHC